MGMLNFTYRFVVSIGQDGGPGGGTGLELSNGTWIGRKEYLQLKSFETI